MKTFRVPAFCSVQSRGERGNGSDSAETTPASRENDNYLHARHTDHAQVPSRLLLTAALGGGVPCFSHVRTRRLAQKVKQPRKRMWPVSGGTEIQFLLCGCRAEVKVIQMISRV